ncbi:MAG: nucleotidyltransferase family protein [alpha proteobacterium HIMB114]|nr:MAG: nucleotidyltransferase family protein [alpha proteobacterium HIMB114]
MDLKKAIILCAGFGKRVLPLTKTLPKPLLKVNQVPLIEYSIRILKELGIEEIAVNVHHLKDKIIEYLDTYHPNIKIFNEEIILDTGGALVNAKSFLSEDYFVILNSDTIWQKNYIPFMKSLIHKTIENNFNAGLLLARKENSFDENLNPDFSLNDNLLVDKKDHIYTGFQIMRSNLLEKRKLEPFSVKKIWDDLIIEKKITGEVFEETFYHTTDFQIYNKLKKINIIF